MKVLHINLNYNQSTLYKDMSKHLIKHGIKMKMFYPAIEGNEIENSPDFLDQVTILNNFDRYFYNNRNKKVVNYLIENYNLGNYDVLHAHSLFSNGNIAFTLNKKYKIPYIVALRDTDINLFFKKMIHLRNRGIRILNNAEKIIFLSKSYKEKVFDNYIPKHLRESFEQKIELIPNGIDPFWHANKSLSIPKNKNNKVTIISIGTINKRKNSLTTAKACQLFKEKYNLNVNLILIGKIIDQKYFDKVKSFPFVKHIDFINQNELINYYREADLLVLPSITETFGLVYAEAISQGLPVIYSAGEGFDQQFDDGVVGYSVNKYDIRDISEKMYKALQNRETLSENCIQLVDKFSWDKIAKKYLEIYNETLNLI